MPDRIARRVLIIGWDAADWKIIDPLIARGEMPNLAALIRSGVRGDLTSLDPKLSPLLWTSIATGKTADKHGVLNFVEPDPSGAGLRVSASTTRRTKALWNILSQNGLTTSVVSWYATHPAEPIRGTIVSNLFQEGLPPKPDGDWPLPPASVHPPAAAQRTADLRMHPADLTGEDLLAMLPALRTMDHRDRRVQLLARQIAQCATVHNVATDLISNTDTWDCAMVFYETIDVVGHHFMQYHPPRMAHVPEKDFELFREVMNGTYRLHDQMLGRLLELAGPETTVILLSDHGFHSDHLRPRVQAALDDPHAAMDATWHRPLGVLVMAGPGIKQGGGADGGVSAGVSGGVSGGAVFGANLLDIAPTALTLLGIPVGADMDGRVLVEAFDRPVEIERIFTWDAMEGEAGMHPADMRIDPFDASQSLAQLADLGYIQNLPADAAAQIAVCRRETMFNLGVVYMSTQRPVQAAEVFTELHAQHPDEPRFAMNLAYCLHASGRTAEAVTLLEELVAKHPQSPDARLLHGSALFAQGNVAAAAAALEAAEKQSPDRPDLLCTLADAYIHLKRLDDAERILSHAGKVDPHDPVVHHRKAQLALAHARYEQAVEHCLDAVALRHFFPEAHYTMGLALTWMQHYPHAIQAFKVAISMQPGNIDACRFVASIYRHLNDRPSARPFRERAEAMMKQRDAGDAQAGAEWRGTPLGPQEWAKAFNVDETED